LGAEVLSIDEHEIDADLGCAMSEQLRDLEQHRHPRATVIRAGNRLAVARRVGVGIAPGSRVPVGDERDPPAEVRAVAADDVGQLDRSAERRIHESMGLDLGAQARELPLDPHANRVVGGCARNPRPRPDLMHHAGECPLAIDVEPSLAAHCGTQSEERRERE